ncbi:hypothetical protein G9A89_006068, partial [Geosiphon pyriformis]
MPHDPSLQLDICDAYNQILDPDPLKRPTAEVLKSILCQTSFESSLEDFDSKEHPKPLMMNPCMIVPSIPVDSSPMCVKL